MKESLRLTSDLLFYAGKYVPNYRPITFCAAHYATRGATPAQEAAFGLASTFTYLQDFIDKGGEIDVTGPEMWFFVDLKHRDFFEEIAKVRALRRIFARTLRERFKAKKAKSLMLRFYTMGGAPLMTKEQYLNNIARTTICCLAGALSGVQTMALPSYDECFGIPTQEAAINAIQTELVIAYETDIPNVVDPLAGSYFIEWLTSEMEERILKQLEEIDKRGGIMQAFESGYLQSLMNANEYKRQKAYEQGELLRVGVNCFRIEGEQRPTEVFRANPKVAEERKSRVQELRKKRDNKAVGRALDEIKAVARLEPKKLENNLVPPIIEAVRCNATTGEIFDALREIWGESHYH
jgi:methylmalonyl-CoA mutase N-terminal domain/subunit